MATEEIEISELEFTEELASDNLIPVEGLTDTKATSLQKLRDWLGIESAILKQVPTGLILPYGGSTAPEGFLLCNGAKINRTTYANLFKAIGTTYGAGDGSTTFNLPNYSSARMVTSSTVAVKGNGKTLGLTNGQSNVSFRTIGEGDTFFNPDVYNTTPTSGLNRTFTSISTSSFGVIQDSTKSGITGTMSIASSCKFIIKY